MYNYIKVVFLQGDDYRPFEAVLYPESSPGDLQNGILLGPPDKDAAMEYLKQWDYMETGEVSIIPPWGASDELYIKGNFVMSWNTGLGYAALTFHGRSTAGLKSGRRIVPRETG